MSAGCPRGRSTDEKEGSMGRIVVSEFVTLDGVMEDPGGGEQSPYGGWAFKFERGEKGDRFKYDELMAADALLLGRRTYEGFAAAWPQMNEDDFGQKMNSMPKYVISSTLSEPSWTNTTVLSGDLAEEARALKEEVGEVLVAGSQQLAAALHGLGLVDEYRLMVFPIVAGGGKRLFAEPTTQASLGLLEAEQAADTVLLRYQAL
jgi:dihydrofolate reductase